MSGVGLAVVSAAIFGLQNAAARRAVISATPLQGMVITVPPMVPLLGIICHVLGGFTVMADWPVHAYLFSGLAGMLHFVLGRNSNYHAMRALGSTLSTPIQQVSTIMSLLLAVLLLNETFSGLNIVGILLVSIAPALLIGRRKSYSVAREGSKFTPDFQVGIPHGLICVIGYGASPVLIVLALQAAGPVADRLANSTAVLFFSYVWAAACVLAMASFSRESVGLRTMSKSGLNWFMVSGTMIAISQIFRYGALAYAPVAVVVPIQRLSIIFRLGFNILINRDYERFDLSIIIGIVLSVIGAAALGMDTETALNWLDLGPGLTEMLNWRF